MACGYAWKSGGGSQAAKVLVGGFGMGGLELLLDVDFGVVVAVLLCFVDLVLKFMRDGLLVDFAGVIGDAYCTLVVLSNDALRGKLISVAALIDCSEMPVFRGSSWTGETRALSALFRVNIERSPPLDSLL
jgi:hypothetical protein